MDDRKINGYTILLAIVIIVGLIMAILAWLAALGKGYDIGVANFIFVIVLSICAVCCLIIMLVRYLVIIFFHTTVPRVMKKWIVKKIPIDRISK